MPLIIPANSASASGGFEVANSVRYNNGSSDYLSRTQSASPTSATKGTFSVWLKRCLLGVDQYIYTVFQDGNNRMQMNMMDSDHLKIIQKVSASTTISLITNRVFRDVSAFYHICIAIDTTQGTASNRIKMYINGVQETSFSTETYPAQNQDAFFTKGTAVSFGAYNSESNYTSGYFSEAVMIDGQQLAPEDNFIEFDEDSGICKPIDVSGLTFGTNGFYLDFEDSAALGDDVSGNGNDFTVNNLTAIDQTTDTPTNNFCTWNAIAAPYSAPTLSEGNTKVTNNAANWQGAIGTFGLASGKWYWEARFDNTTNTYNHGVIDESVNFAAVNPMNATGYTGFYNADGGEIKKDATDTTADYGTFGTNDIIGIALNMDDKQISIYKNGSVIVSNFALSTTSNLVFPCTVYYTSGICSYNFGNAPYTISSGNADGNSRGNFEYLPPEGYFALCTANLAEFG